MDRRIQKTEQSIKNSFLFLLQTNDIHKITVSEICAGANINRCTFYSHYKDVQDLYEHMKNEFAADFLDSFGLYHLNMDSKELTDRLFLCIKQHQQLFLLMASSDHHTDLFCLIPDSIKEQTLALWMAKSSLSHEEADMLFTYIVAGAGTILQKWVQSDFAMEENKLKALFDNAIKYGLCHFIRTT